MLRIHKSQPASSVSSDVAPMVQLRTSMFLLVLANKLGSKSQLYPSIFFGFSDLSCSVDHEGVWEHLGTNTFLDTSGECKK